MSLFLNYDSTAPQPALPRQSGFPRPTYVVDLLHLDFFFLADVYLSPNMTALLSPRTRAKTGKGEKLSARIVQYVTSSLHARRLSVRSKKPPLRPRWRGPRANSAVLHLTTSDEINKRHIGKFWALEARFVAKYQEKPSMRH